MSARTLTVLLGVIARGAAVLTERGYEEATPEPGAQVVISMNPGRPYLVNTVHTAFLNRLGVVWEFR